MANSQDEAPVYGWDNCPAPIKQLVSRLLQHYRKTLADSLTGFYLHGSLAMDCFNPSASDVDFLAVVKEELTIPQKKSIIDYLLKEHANLPVKGIEMSIVLEEYLKNFVYPTPFELHYSSDLYDGYKSGQVDYSRQNCDEDLAAHFVITRTRGICLFGKPVEEAFPEIPEAAYAQSLSSDANWIYRDIERHPVYTVLNLCRILAFLKDSRITSKKEGGQWALSNLPGRFSPLIESALDGYSGASGQQRLDLAALRSFVTYARSEIDALKE